MDYAAPTQSANPGLFSHDWFVRHFQTRGVPETIVCAAAALVYVATLSFGFVYDDVPQILRNPAIHAWRFVPSYFTSHVWAAIYPNTSGNYYRPVFLLWLRLNYALFGSRATAWHLTSVACHVLATWLVFRVAQKLAGDRITAFLTALIFALHPAHIENVVWISGVSDPLMTCFLLGSLLAFLELRGGREWRASREIRYQTLSLGLFLLALLSKETAIVFPVLVAIFVLIFDQHERALASGGRIAVAMRASAPYMLFLLVYAIVRFRALGGWSHPTIPIGWTEVLLTWPSVLWFYARHLILPVGLSEFYPLDYVTHFSARTVLLPLALFLLMVLAVLLMVRKISTVPPVRAVPFGANLGSFSPYQSAQFALILIIVPLLPVLDLRSLTVGDIVHDRYLYLPSAGFALLIALAIRELAQRLPGPSSKFLPAAATITVAVAFAALTLRQQMSWASDILLYTRGLESAPSNLTVRDNLASSLLNVNQPARAVPLYLEVLKQNPNFWRSNYNLGFAYFKTLNFQAAEYYLQRAIAIDPRDPDQYIYLALDQVQMRKFAEAIANANQAIARNPHARGYHFALGTIYEDAGDRTRAAAEFKTELAQHPENASAITELEKVEEKSSAP